MPTFVIIEDIYFQEMILKAAEEKDALCLFLKEEKAFWDALQEGIPEVILIEIGISSLDGPGLIQKLKQNPSTKGIPLIAFGGSLRADLLQDAREMGADKALSKSAFREQLTGIIRHYSKGQGGQAGKLLKKTK